MKMEMKKSTNGLPEYVLSRPLLTKLLDKFGRSNPNAFVGGRVAMDAFAYKIGCDLGWRHLRSVRKYFPNNDVSYAYNVVALAYNKKKDKVCSAHRVIFGYGEHTTAGIEDMFERLMDPKRFFDRKYAKVELACRKSPCSPLHAKITFVDGPADMVVSSQNVKGLIP